MGVGEDESLSSDTLNDRVLLSIHNPEAGAIGVSNLENSFSRYNSYDY
jgi:hypothetical protein